jgi:hypothetical protein
VSWLESFLEADGRDRAYAARLALPRALAEEVVASGPHDRESLAKILGSWRDALIGETVRAALDGDLSTVVRAGDVAIVSGRATLPPGSG